MTNFSELTPEQLARKMRALNVKLLKKPTKEETLWYEFASKNQGFEFLDKKSGKTLSKLDFFVTNHNRPTILNLASQNLLHDWRRVVKVGWTTIDIGMDVMGAVLTEDLPVYNKAKKRRKR